MATDLDLLLPSGWLDHAASKLPLARAGNATLYWTNIQHSRKCETAAIPPSFSKPKSASRYCITSVSGSAVWRSVGREESQIFNVSSPLHDTFKNRQKLVGQER